MILEELKDLLRKHNVPFQKWGQPGKKDLAELLKEINDGDSRLMEVDGRLFRRVECATLDVFHIAKGGQKLRLKETHQIVHDRYRKRVRNWSIYEKKRPDEDPLLCARRALAEELGITDQLRLHGIPIKYDECESRSFSGLHCTYAFHPFNVYLPKSWYRPEGYVDTSEAPREYTYFKWV